MTCAPSAIPPVSDLVWDSGIDYEGNAWIRRLALISTGIMAALTVVYLAMAGRHSWDAMNWIGASVGILVSAAMTWGGASWQFSFVRRLVVAEYGVDAVVWVSSRIGEPWQRIERRIGWESVESVETCDLTANGLGYFPTGACITLGKNDAILRHRSLQIDLGTYEKAKEFVSEVEEVRRISTQKTSS
jgi:hypothetical protein